MSKKRKDKDPILRKIDIKAKSEGQQDYIDAINESDMVFCIGPAGSGKTAIAVAMAVKMFFDADSSVEKIVVTRPTVSTDKDNCSGIGFLPGDMLEKMNPYLIPIYDEMAKYVVNKSLIKQYIHEGKIEIVPLDYMRGRTFHDSFVIMDEAQNATYEQIKMIVTRLGSRSKMVINGDIDQFDRRGSKSALQIWVDDILPQIEEIEIIELETCDIVRNKIVAKIVNRLKKWEEIQKRI